jgi:hypothetical protein
VRDEGPVHGPADVGAAGSSPPSVDLLVVTANPAVSLSLPDRSVVEVGPARLATWLRSVDRPLPRGVVLDVGSPSTASQDLATLRANRVLAPVVLVTDGSEGWLDLTDDGVVQLGPPVTRAALRDAVEALLSLPPVAPSPRTRSRRWALATELAPRLKVLDPDPVGMPATSSTAKPEPPPASTSAPEVAETAAPSTSAPDVAETPTVAVVEAPATDTAEPDVVEPHVPVRPSSRERSAPERGTPPRDTAEPAAFAPKPEDVDPPTSTRHSEADPLEPGPSEPAAAPSHLTPQADASEQETPVPDAPRFDAPEPDPPEPDEPEPDTPEVPRHVAPDTPTPPAPDTPPRPAPDASPPPAREVPSVFAPRGPGPTIADRPLSEEERSTPAAAASSAGHGQRPSRPAVETGAGAVAQPPSTPGAGTYTERRPPLALVTEDPHGYEHSENGHPAPPKREKPGLRNRLAPKTKARRGDRTTAATTAPAPEAAPSEHASGVPAAWLDSHRSPGAVVDTSAPEVGDPPPTREIADRSTPPREVVDRSAQPTVDTPPHEVVDRSAQPTVDTPPHEVVDRSAQPAADPPVRRVGDAGVREAVETTSRDVVDRPNRDVVEHPARTEVASTTAAPHLRRRDVMHLVREILERSDELFVYHLGIVAQAIVEDVIENLPADAACVLVRDEDGGWHVEGASGLRETETELVLDDDHWLVAQTVRSSAAVAIEDTDIARVQLRGAPLASWPHLMAEGTPDGRALVIAARDVSGEGFIERDVVRIAELCQEGQRYLAAGHDVRTLVRRLSED